MGECLNFWEAGNSVRGKGEWDREEPRAMVVCWWGKERRNNRAKINQKKQNYPLANHAGWKGIGVLGIGA